MVKLSALALIPLVCIAGCGGGGGGGSTTPPPPPPPPSGLSAGPPNVESISQDGGPSALTIPAVNTAFVSVKICAPGSTTSCNTIDHVEVDTGSVGLRIIAGGSVGPGGGELTVALKPVTDASGNPLAECQQFADGFSWGSVATADITLPVSGESAAGVNIQVIGAAAAGDPSKANPSCVPAPPLVTENTVPSFGANGILGVGPFQNDCLATSTCDPGGSSTYYSCVSGVCTQTTTTSLAQIVPNPATKFAKDNNGVIIVLPTVASGGAANPSGGLLAFGIGTQSNNGLGNATKLPADPQTGYIAATLNGNSLPDSYLDSGSNGNFFASSLPVCAAPNNGFFCPSAATAQNATLGSGNLAADFTVDNAVNMFNANASGTAFPDLGGPNPDPKSLDLGLPFFFGKHVYLGFGDPSSGTAPYFAY